MGGDGLLVRLVVVLPMPIEHGGFDNQPLHNDSGARLAMKSYGDDMIFELPPPPVPQ